jgi:hypothetical protein
MVHGLKNSFHQVKRINIVKKVVVSLVLISLILTLVAISGIRDRDIFKSSLISSQTNSRNVAVQPQNATATYGAAQWHIQLTEMAKPPSE